MGAVPALTGTVADGTATGGALVHATTNAATLAVTLRMAPTVRRASTAPR
jgi:hypothetical protein